jgi:hypothetical protein
VPSIPLLLKIARVAFAVAAFPRRNLAVLAALLSGFGALIELAQGLPMVHRDRDFWDWVAATIAITCALAPMLLYWWRQQVGQVGRQAGSAQKYIDTKA